MAMRECPTYVVALLRDLIDRYLSVCWWNMYQENMPSPFDNTGAKYENDVFSVHAYDWSEEDETPNFVCGDVEIRWYKYLGRGTTVNREVTPVEAVEMYDRCRASIKAEFGKYAPDARS